MPPSDQTCFISLRTDHGATTLHSQFVYFLKCPPTTDEPSSALFELTIRSISLPAGTVLNFANRPIKNPATDTARDFIS
jgi:hypothetical protein